MLTASTLLAFAVTGAVDLDPFSLQLWSAQAAARAAAEPSETAQDIREDALDVLSQQAARQDAADAATAAAEAVKLGGVGSIAPVVGLPPADRTPTPSPRDLAIETAQRQAQSTDKPVPVPQLTTETALTTAQPDGTLSTTTALGPVRYRADGGTGADASGTVEWVDLDLSLTGQDAAGRTTAEAAGPWAARLAAESGTSMVSVGPDDQTISWSPQAAAAPVGRGGPGGALPVVKPTAPSTGVTPVVGGVDLQVQPEDAPPAPGQGAGSPDAVATTPPTASRAGLKAAAVPAEDTPVDAGSEAQYPGVLQGGRDYTVSVTATGAEESVVLTSREAVAAAGGTAAAAVYRNQFTLPAGVSVRQAAAAGGTDPSVLGVEFVDASGAVIATYGGGKAFDASSNQVGEPATAPVATRLLATSAGTGTTAGTATVEVSIDPTWLGDSARTFPVTIDPHMATGTGFSGATGSNGSANVDAYVDEAFPTTAEGVQDSGRLLAGYRPINGANKASTTLVYFNLGDLIGSENTIFNAQFSLWNNYSYSCTPHGLWVDAATGPWNPATVTWNNRPAWANAGSMKTFAHGYSSACAAAAEYYDVTPIVQKWSNGTAGYYGGLANNGFIITADGTSTNGYKRFNSGETGSGMPGLTVSWENCTNYPTGAGGSGTRKVCGSIRDDFALNGGPGGFGLPTTSDAATPNGKGYFNHFDKSGQARSIYWTQATGAHSVVGAIRTRWAADGWETSVEGWPASDDKATPSGNGFYNHFYNLDDQQTRSIYWTSTTGAKRVDGLIRDRWAAVGWEAIAGYPSTDETTITGGKKSDFVPVGVDGAGWGPTSIYWKAGAPMAWSVHGRILGVYKNLGESSSWLGFPTSNEYSPTIMPGGGAAPADAKQTDFENGVIYGDSRNGYTAVIKTGAASMPAPSINQHTARRLPLEVTINAPAASAATWPDRLSAPVVQYRRGAKGATPNTPAQPGSQWKNIAVGDLLWPNGQSVSATGGAATMTVKNAAGQRVLNPAYGGGRLYWDAGKTLAGVAGILDVRFVFTDTTTNSQVPVATVGGVEYDPDAGQSGTTTVGPGTLNLLTGAVDLSATDASAFGLSISRTASSRRTTAGNENIAGSPFGAQWAMGGVDDDLDLGWTSIRQTSDYSLDVVDASGQATSFAIDDAGTTWYPETGDEDLKLVGVGGTAVNPFLATSWTLTDGDGTVTVFKNRVEVTAPATVAANITVGGGRQTTWQVDSVAPAGAGTSEAAMRNATRYYYVSVPATDVAGKQVSAMRLSRIGAANPALSSTAQGACLTTATPGAGCRVLQLNWNAASGPNARVTSIDLFATDPTNGTASALRLTDYVYDSSNRLSTATDTRSGLSTTYTYRSDYASAAGTTAVTVPGPVATITPAGQKPWTFTYGEVASTYDTGQAGSKGRLLSVSRPNLAPGEVTTEAGSSTWDVVYSVPLDITAFGPYPMSPQAAVTWGQEAPPLDATAVYGPTADTDARTSDHDSGNDVSDGTARNWTTAAVTYMDVNGHTVNIAQPSPAAGRWVASGSWSTTATTAANVTAVSAASLDTTRNGAGQAGPNGGSGGTAPGADVVAIPVKGARISAAVVNDAGNTTFSLTAANRALTLGQDDPGALSASGPTAADQLDALSTVPSGGTTPSGGSTPNLKGAVTWQRAQLLSTQTRYELSRSTFTDGPQLIEPTEVAVTSTEPLRLTQTNPTSNGSAVAVPARSISYTEYDNGRPTTGAQASELPTKITTGYVAGSDELLSNTVSVRYKDTVDGQWKLRQDPATYFGIPSVSTAMLRPRDASDARVHDIRYTETTYEWTGASAGKPTWTKSSAEAAGSTETRTSYDVFGRAIASSMPRNSGGTGGPDTSTASTTLTRYYGDTAAGFGTNNCTTATGASNAVLFGGMVCSTGPANVAVTGSSGLPTSTTTYTRTGQPAVVTETLTPNGTSNTQTLRTTSTMYDAADRPQTATTTTANTLSVAAGTEVKSFTYDAMGNPTTTTDAGSTAIANGRTLSSVYDQLGRVVTSTDATGLKTSTTYDTSGRVASTTVTDTNTSSTNTGDAAITGYSAVTAGKTWRQTNTYDAITGDMTSTTDEAPSGQASAGTMTMVIDVDGRTVATTASGGYTKKTLYDTTGAAVRRTVIAGGQTVLDEANAATLTSFGGGENTYSQQVESYQQLKAIARNSSGDPAGTTATDQNRHRRYSYDGLGRLISSADSRLAPIPNAMSCTVRAWAYDPDSNQTARASTPTNNGACAATGYTIPSTSTAGGNTLSTHTMNALDQITDNGYNYDGLGRTLAIPTTGGNLPATTATGATGTGLSIAYAPGDMVASQTLATGAGNELQTFTLDPTGDRLLLSTTTLPGQGAKTITNRYNDTDDNPAFINEADDTVSRYITGPDADLTAAAILKTDGSTGLTWQIINLHGDVVATIPGGVSASATASTMTDEFGTVLDTTTGQNNTAASRYDWLGGKQRSSNARAGLTLMGARLYNPGTARFLSVDPVTGGGANDYAYPTDAINQFDLDGQKWSLKKAAKLGLNWAGHHKLDIALTALMFVPGLGMVAAGARIIRVGMMVARAERIGRAAQASSRAAKIFDGWSRATFPNRLKSLQFHYAKHGKGQGIVQYALSGARLAERVGATGKKVTVRGSGGGKVGPDGRTLTHW